MIAETGVGGFPHLTGSDADGLTAEHRVLSIPHFVFIGGDGSSDTMVGWSEEQFSTKLDALGS